jgi:hypothetical protein
MGMGFLSVLRKKCQKSLTCFLRVIPSFCVSILAHSILKSVAFFRASCPVPLPFFHPPFQRLYAVAHGVQCLANGFR